MSQRQIFSFHNPQIHIFAFKQPDSPLKPIERFSYNYYASSSGLVGWGKLYRCCCALGDAALSGVQLRFGAASG
jgi:hypothetical protein